MVSYSVFGVLHIAELLEQAAQIRDAMQRIAARRPGRIKLIYDKAVGIVAVSDDGTRTPLNIVAKETE